MLFHPSWQLHFFLTYAGTGKRQYESLKFRVSTQDKFKFLIFGLNLKSQINIETRRKILSRLEQNDAINLQPFVEECQKLLTFKHHTSQTEENESSLNMQAMHINRFSNKDKIEKCRNT